jgi:putative tryptophan/tyrosine transport system substrate-binding protein
MRRREFITLIGGATAWPLAARAQQVVDRVHRVAVVTALSADDPETKANMAAFRHELESRGWLEGRNLHIDYRFATVDREQLASLVRELIAAQPEVIVAQATEVTAAVVRQTKTIPIVFNNASDPIGSGFIASLAHPGGNVTGFLLYEEGIVGKWLLMLKEIAPHLTRAGLVANPATTPFDYYRRSAEAVAQPLATELVFIPLVGADSDIERAVASFAAAGNGGLIVLPDISTTGRRDIIIAVAARYGVPAVYPFRFFVDAGGLMSYGVDRPDIYRLSATYVDRILRGEKPADLPVQEPIKYQTVVNLKTAKAAGLGVPSSLLVRADEVIE